MMQREFPTAIPAPARHHRAAVVHAHGGHLAPLARGRRAAVRIVDRR